MQALKEMLGALEQSEPEALARLPPGVRLAEIQGSR